MNQVVGRCKTEASQKPVPIDEYTMGDLLTWFRETPFREPEDWFFATNGSRAGEKRGKQQLWLSTVMRYHIEPDQSYRPKDPVVSCGSLGWARVILILIGWFQATVLAAAIGSRLKN